MKIFTVDFIGVYPVGCCLVIAARDNHEAYNIAKETIKHTDVFTVTEVNISKPVVIFYADGDY